MQRSDKPISIAIQPNAGFDVGREVTGACRVVHVRGYREVDVQTHFEIETG